MISLDKEYRTRDGRKVRLLCIDGPDESFPVAGFIEGATDVFIWRVDGKVNRTIEHLEDLIESKPRVKKTVWLYHYDDGSIGCFSRGDRVVTDYTIARTKHEIDVEHGHGLGDANE